jgi:YD repeat-containing protein
MRQLLVASLVLLSVSTIAAHVTVQPRQAPAKSFQEYVVRVPTEKDTPTLSVRMVFPEGFEVLRFRPTPGWKYEVERDAKGRIVAVTWSGGKVGREEYEQFSFLARAANPGTYQLDAYQPTRAARLSAGSTRRSRSRRQRSPSSPRLPITGAQAAGDPFAAGAAAPGPAAPSASSRGWLAEILAGTSLLVSLAALMAARRRSRG